jgi:hypothetical protein
MSTRNISWEGIWGQYVGLITLPLSCAETRNLGPQPSGTHWAFNSCNFHMKQVAKKKLVYLEIKKMYTQMHVKWLHIIPWILQDFWILFVLWDEIFTIIKHQALILIIAYAASYIFLNLNSNCRRQKTSIKQPVIQFVDWYLNMPELFSFGPLHFYDKTKQATNFVVRRKS